MTASAASPDTADHRALVLRTLEAFRPPQRANVADFAAAQRWLVNSGGGYTGRWNHDEVPYLVGPMQALTSRLFTSTALVGPGQCGKTEIALNWLLQSVATDPADFLWYMQTDRVMRDTVKDRIDTLIRDHPVMAERLGIRSSDSTQEYKRFRGMSAHFLVAAQSTMISRKAPRIVADEIDNFDASIRSSFFTQIDVRRTTYGRDSMVLGVSHPDLATSAATDAGWNTGIMSLYRASTRNTWWWRCPHCDAWSSPNPNAARVMTLHYPEDASPEVVAAEARLLCPVNGCLIEDRHRRAMNIEALAHHGGWLAEGQHMDEDGVVEGEPIRSDVAGFWIVGVMSTLMMGGIGALAAARVEAERAHRQLADETSLRNLRDVFTKKLGIPFEPPREIGALDAATLHERARPDLALGRVPDGVRFITAFADTQGNRFEIMFRGWGAGGESWVIAVETMEDADPATSPGEWNRLFERLLTACFPLADGSGRVMRVRAAGVDSAGGPGVTQQAYSAWRRWYPTGRLRRLGLISGREAWNLLLTKGLGGVNAARLQVSKTDTQRKDRHAGGGGVVKLGTFAANTFKDDLAGQLAVAQAGDWAVHIPKALETRNRHGDPSPPHLFFEGLVAETRYPNGVWKHESQFRNEPTDLMVGTHVVAHLHGLARMPWASPPAWAGAWDTNPLVGPAPSFAETVAASTIKLVQALKPPVAAAAPAALTPHNAPPVIQAAPKTLAERLANYNRT